MYDELVKRLREETGWKNASEHYLLMKEAADAIEQLIKYVNTIIRLKSEEEEMSKNRSFDEVWEDLKTVGEEERHFFESAEETARIINELAGERIQGGMSMDRRRTQNLVGKCGSCRFFTVEQGRDCTGFCSGRMKRKGRIERTYKCIGYEAAPTIIEAEEGRVMKYICDSCEKYPCSADETKLMLSCPAYSPKPKPQTKADLIRAMTDEELSAWLSDHPLVSEYDENNPKHKAWLDWLKQEANDAT